MKDLLLGIDIGTSACKAAVFDLNGHAIDTQTQEYEVLYPHPGWVEQNPEDWWNAVTAAIRALLKSVDPARIAGIGVDGQSWSAIPVNRDGQVLANTPIWSDTRAGEECAELSKKVTVSEIFELCGNPLSPSYTLPKILWFKKHFPQVYSDTYKFLQSNSFINLRLTGVFSQDLSQGYGFFCFDMRKGCWDTAVCARMGVDPALLPDISPCHQVIGHVTGQAAQLTGLLPGTPVVAGGLDAACGTLGAGVIHPGETQEQGGQAGGMSICADSCKPVENLILSYHVVPGHWLLQGGTVGGGGVMRWLGQELGEAEHLREQETGKNAFALLDERAAVVAPGSDGVVFLPYMSGERSPIWDTHAKGVYFGLDFSKTKGHLVRASLEGTAYALRHNLETAEDGGVPAGLLYAMGGAANSLLWTQIKADVTGKDIEVPCSDNATSLGAAILAGVGVGLYRDFDEAREKTFQVLQCYTPNLETKKAYDKGYRIYRKLYEDLKDTMKSSDDETSI